MKSKKKKKKKRQIATPKRSITQKKGTFYTAKHETN